jgi:hypothetical protein
MRKVLLAVVAVAVALMAAGCGSVASKPAPTLAQFAAQANELCGTLAQEQEAISARWAHGFKPEGVGETEWIDLSHVAREADSKIGALPRPPAQARTIEQLMLWYAEELTYEGNYASAAEHREVLNAEVAFRTFIADAKRNAAVARRLGMTTCAKTAPESPATSVAS